MIDEPDHKPIGLFTKDGDALLLVLMLPEEATTAAAADGCKQEQDMEAAAANNSTGQICDSQAEVPQRRADQNGGGRSRQQAQSLDRGRKRAANDNGDYFLTAGPSDGAAGRKPNAEQRANSTGELPQHLMRPLELGGENTAPMLMLLTRRRMYLFVLLPRRQEMHVSI